MRRRTLRYAANLGLVRTAMAAAMLAAATVIFCSHVAESAEWIWSPEHTVGEAPAGECYFRKSFTAGELQRAKLTVAGDDRFEVYLNGRRIIQGTGWKDPKSYNILPLVSSGNNVLAVKASNAEPGPAGFAATVELTRTDDEIIQFGTDNTWKTSLRPLAFWHLPRYSDARWDDAMTLGQQGATEPWLTDTQRKALDNVAANTADDASPEADLEVAAVSDGESQDAAPEPIAIDESLANDDTAEERPAPSAPDNQTQFRTQRDFEVQVLATHDQVGSLIACEFNEFNELLVSRENGPLLILVDTNKDQIPDSPRVYCDEVKNVQGILPVNGDVFVTAEGPQGNALYRLSDKDKDGQLEVVETLMKFRHAASEDEQVGEHGPHGLALGPDGNIYVVIGNHAIVDGELADASPYNRIYEGDIVPRFEDPTGHANGIKSPGGTIVRVPIKPAASRSGAAGPRNAYDLAFDQWGNLFTYDSDMEADEGTTWYHPTRVMHVISGGEYGWRSGWAKWPNYWHDGLPTVVETGRGSPTGIVMYDHFMYPEKFQHDLLLADWTGGRILHVDMQPKEGTFRGASDVLMQGEPLTISDLAVGPDGWVYFVTGGRDTAGAVYRLVYTGDVPEPESRIGDGVAAAIRYPQFQSAWSRQEIAKIKHAEADRWDAVLPAIARTEKNSPRFRTRALDLMHLYGPALSEDLLIQISKDENTDVRAKAVEVMGWRPKDAYRERLIEALADDDATVRRKACEAMVRAGFQPKLTVLQPLLLSPNRFESFAARRLLETVPSEKWREDILKTDQHRLFIQGSTALLLVEGNKQAAVDVLNRMHEHFAGYVTDADFTDMLRLAQIAVEWGGITAEDVPEVTAALANEFPSGNVVMNRELLRLLVALNVNTIGDRYITYLESGLKPADQLQVALHLALIDGGWTGEQRVALLKNLEKLRQQDGGASRGGYVQNVSRMFVKQLSEDEQRLVLADAADMPTAALAVLYLLPEEPDTATLDALRQAYADIDGRTDEASQQFQVGIIAVLGESADETSMDFLRRQYPNDPNKQAFLAMSLAQKPDGANWDVLLDSLRVVEGMSAKMVLESLATVNQKPAKPEAYRQTIIRGLELGDNGQPAIELLEHWTGQSQPGETAPEQLAAWQKWFQLRWPQEPLAALPKSRTESKWIYDELVAHVSSDANIEAGSAHRGERVFVEAQCVKCHRYGDAGDSIGPDLTNVANRFRRKEILESIVYPSHVISDQYRAKTIVTNRGKQYTGIIAAGAPGEVVVLQADGTKVVVQQDEIDETLPSRLSSMPEGLLDELSLQQVTDLFTYLSEPASASTATRPVRE